MILLRQKKHTNGFVAHCIYVKSVELVMGKQGGLAAGEFEVERVSGRLLMSTRRFEISMKDHHHHACTTYQGLHNPPTFTNPIIHHPLVKPLQSKYTLDMWIIW